MTDLKPVRKSGTVRLSLDDLIVLLDRATNQDGYIDLLLDWARHAESEIRRLEAINRDQHKTTVDPVMDIHIELSALINRYSLENGSDTPDFALSQYLMACLRAYEQAVRQRDNWAGLSDPDEHLLHGWPDMRVSVRLP